MNFLFSDTIKPKKPLAPPHAEPGEEEDDKVWICPVCSVAYVEGADMVACDGCDNWFHWYNFTLFIFFICCLLGFVLD